MLALAASNAFFLAATTGSSKGNGLSLYDCSYLMLQVFFI